jgi:hypothetical protein
MSAQWETWARENQVVPWIWKPPYPANVTH